MLLFKEQALDEKGKLAVSALSILELNGNGGAQEKGFADLGSFLLDCNRENTWSRDFRTCPGWSHVCNFPGHMVTGRERGRVEQAR